MRSTKAFICCSALFLLVLSYAKYSYASNDVFPTPDILRDRVAFWKKIYTEFSLHDGVIHDRDYPVIIYKKIFGDVSTSNVKRQKERIIASLNTINTQPQSSWTKDELDIAEMFQQNGLTDKMADAAERIRFQQGQADRFKQGLVRSGSYLDTIRTILRQHGVPERLAYLPHVESSFNTAAYSKVGAAGLWQFMRGTGKTYGMKINYTIDERRDPVIATHGAARYLSNAYRELQAWPLAITSYNHGINGMKRAVNATGSRDLGYIIKNYESKSFKFASSNFYSCFLAASEIAENHLTYFPNLKLASKIEYTDFTLTHYIRPDILCKYLNISSDQLVILNPAIRPAVFEQKNKLPAGFRIHIPSAISGNAIATALAAIPDSLKSNEPEKSKYYKVNRGDNLISIASRLGVSVQELANENHIGRKNHLMIGQLLRVPERKTVLHSAHVASAAAIAPIQDKSDTKIEKAVTSAPLKSDKVIEISQHVTKSKGTPEQVNPVKTNQVKVEPPPQAVKSIKPEPVKTVEIPVADSLKEIAAEKAVESKTEKPNERPAVQGNFDVSIYNLDITPSSDGSKAEIIVSIDETIGHYADWLGIPTSQIRRTNNMGRGSDIRINKKLTIPVSQKDMLDQFVQARLEYHMAIEEDFYLQYRVSDVKKHILRKNETLWDICNANDNDNVIPLWLFKKYNKHLDLNFLMPGSTVWIPVIIEKSVNDSTRTEEVQNPGYYSPFEQPKRPEPKIINRLP